MYKYDVVYLNQSKETVLITIEADDRSQAYNTVKDFDDCRKYHQVPNICSITQHTPASQ